MPEMADRLQSLAESKDWEGATKIIAELEIILAEVQKSLATE